MNAQQRNLLWSCKLCGILTIGFLCLNSLQTTDSRVITSVLKKKCQQLAYYTEPKCLNYTDGYGCDCGPGFHWNTEMCMSTAIDSRLEFEEKEPVRYTLLLGKAFPKLKEFTIGFWIRVHDNISDSTIFSYKHNRRGNIFRLMLRDFLTFDLWQAKISTRIKLQMWRWYHIIWAWTSQNGEWELFVDNELQESGVDALSGTVIPSGGDFVVGQSYDYQKYASGSSAFVGDLAHMNIWNVNLTSKEREEIYSSCKFMYCGNVVQWADFRSGTRGAMKLRWPSGIVNRTCFTASESASTCNQWCSDEIGAQCNMEIVENILWVRTPAVKNMTVPCPGQEEYVAQNETYDTATRTCFKTNKNEGIWSKAYIDNCISEELKMIKWNFPEVLDEELTLDYCHQLLNHTRNNSYTNPIDVATVIDLLEKIVNTQAQAIFFDVETLTDGNHVFKKTTKLFPSIQQTFEFSEIIISIVNFLLKSGNDKGWSVIQPQGVEGDNLLKVISKFAKVIAKSLEHHIMDKTLRIEDAKILKTYEFIEFKIEVQIGEEFLGYLYPDLLDRSEADVSSENGYIRVPANLFIDENATSLPYYVGISSFRFGSLAKHLPNHNVKSKSKDNHVNTPVIALYIFANDADFLDNLTNPITFTLPFLDNFNISNFECARIHHGYENESFISLWNWTRNGCHLVHADDRQASCACYVPGVYAVITDMYNVNWNRGIKKPILMNAASYIGCSLAALMCLITVIIHVRFKSSSSTASLHKNLAMSIVLSQIVFMAGIDRYDFPVICRVFAVLLHYLVLCNYAWLMNEAFNQYIVITYSAHSHGELTDSGSLFRYYFLGWIIPAVLVGAFVGSQGNNYYALEMCCTSWDSIWILIGPIVGFITITIMVLIFTAKEHNENSYTKSEKTNKIILIHMKGLWIQIILMTVAWSFAFLSLKMQDSIIKYLYALMNILQSAFFVVFFLFLHEEIQTVIKSRQKTKKLANQAFDADDPSTESFIAYNIREKESSDTVPLAEKTKETTRKRKLRIPVNSEEDQEESDDCEMVTTV